MITVISIAFVIRATSEDTANVLPSHSVELERSFKRIVLSVIAVTGIVVTNPARRFAFARRASFVLMTNASRNWFVTTERNWRSSASHALTMMKSANRRHANSNASVNRHLFP